MAKMVYITGKTQSRESVAKHYENVCTKTVLRNLALLLKRLDKTGGRYALSIEIEHESGD